MIDWIGGVTCCGAMRVVDLSEIREVRLGQKTTVFMKNKVPEHEHVSFSLLYGTDRTLDIVCKDKYEFDTWVTGLKALVFEPELIVCT
jgi:hypothetical protein